MDVSAHSALCLFGIVSKQIVIVSIWNRVYLEFVHSGSYLFGIIVSFRDHAHSRLCPLGIAYIWNGAHSGLCLLKVVSIWYCLNAVLCLFGIVSIRNRVYSESCPFGMVTIRYSVHMRSCSFGIVSMQDRSVHFGWCRFGIVSIWYCVLCDFGSCLIVQMSGCHLI